jgi:thiamine kinase-like enzyme
MSASIDVIKGLGIWQSDVEPQPLPGGLSNENFAVEDGGETFVVRMVGDDVAVHHVFRDNEFMASRAAHAAGFSPKVMHARDGVMVLRFINGRTFEAEDVRDNMGRVADLVRRFHTEMPRHITGPGRLFWPFHVVRDYANTLRAGNSRMMPEVPGYMALAEELEAVQPPLPIVYAHNDLLPANFIDDSTKIWLIDFEYAAYSTAMFDLAGVSSMARFSPEQDAALLAAYLGEAPSAGLSKAHAAMKCAALLREAMWSMVSELHLDAPGVNYQEYTAENLEGLETAVYAYKSRFG